MNQEYGNEKSRACDLPEQGKKSGCVWAPGTEVEIVQSGPEEPGKGKELFALYLP